jgi:phage shock protein PspC (stress-responsive transcriptional regulator)
MSGLDRGDDPGGECGVEMSRMARPLRLSRRNRKIAGVCGGLAEWLGWDPTVVRVLYIVISVVSAAFPGILVYLILWLVIPRAPRESQELAD